MHLQSPDGATLFVHDSRPDATGPTLLLIAGAVETHDFWDDLVPDLEEKIRPIVWDAAGTGQSGSHKGELTVEQMASDAARILESLGAAPAAVLGHSLGALVALQLAQSRPDLVNHLFFVSGIYPGPSLVMASADIMLELTNRQGDQRERVHRDLRLRTSPSFIDSPRFHSLLSKRLARQSNGVQYLRQARAGANFVGKDRLDHPLPLPVSLVFGTDDLVTPPENGHRMVQKLEQMGHTHHPLTMLDHVGHLLPVEAPDRLAKLVAEALSER